MVSKRKKEKLWKSLRRLLFFWFPWGAGFFYLLMKADYPESVGMQFDHGRAGGAEAFWYSYKLLQYPNFWNVALFIWMWSVLIVPLGWAMLFKKRVKIWRMVLAHHPDIARRLPWLAPIKIKPKKTSQ